MEIVVAKGEDGKYYETHVIVHKRFTLAIDCSCWKHATATHDLEVIVTSGGVYFRRADAQEHFREVGHVGPVAVIVKHQTRME